MAGKKISSMVTESTYFYVSGLLKFISVITYNFIPHHIKIIHYIGKLSASII